MDNGLPTGFTTLLSDKATITSLGKVIQSAEINPDKDNELSIQFEDGSRLLITDECSCCERRYWSTDDDLSALRGDTLIGFHVKEGSEVETEDGDTHEIAFMEIITSKGFTVFSTHNEHNGYYGGVDLVWREETK